MTYYKMMVVGKNLKHRINHAHKVCTQNPKSQQCKVAREQIKETCAIIPECNVDYQDMFAPELEWEPEYDKRFYDI